MVRASSTSRPRMCAMTWRALLGATRTYRAVAFTGAEAGVVPVPAFAMSLVLLTRSSRPLAALDLDLLLLTGATPLDRAGGRELAELVADHRLGDVHRHVL